MGRFVEGADRNQAVLLPECLDDFIAEDNPVRIVDAFVEELELASLGFEGATPAATGRPSYHPTALLKIYIYGYLNRVQSSRRLERECQRNVELMWSTGRLAPDFKTIAEFRRSNGEGIDAPNWHSTIRSAARKPVSCKRAHTRTPLVGSDVFTSRPRVACRGHTFDPAQARRDHGSRGRNGEYTETAIDAGECDD
ncbi:protein of unknown function [Burkholderia multivorans]